MHPIALVLTTFPDAEQARQIGTALIERHLAACVNFLPGVASIYLWQGQLQNDSEVLALFKVAPANLPAFQAALLELHPYDTPEFLALTAEASPAYHAWACGKEGLKIES